MKVSKYIIERACPGICALLLLVLSHATSIGQSGIKLNTPEAFKGFTLCSAEVAKETYLLDNCGKIVNKWDTGVPEHYCRLTDEGNLIYLLGNRFYEKDWDDNMVRTFTPNSPNLLLDYEVMKLENGNYLSVARRFVDSDYFDEIGWLPWVDKPDRVDVIVELDPIGNIVWEWNIADHTIQDQVPSAPRYGVIKDHPELVDVSRIATMDWTLEESFMINGMDYNPELDQIAISVRKVNEIMIIDHSTTTEEAKGSTGGIYGKGGDILYRWGNPQNYGQGDEGDRVLYFQHNPNWIKYGEHKGKIIMFNNGFGRMVPGFGAFSSVHIIDTPIKSDGSYSLEHDKPYAPEEADVTIDEQVTGNYFNSEYTSGAQVLPNGNIFITVGRPDDIMEVKTDGTLVWDYNVASSYYIFRTEKYAPGFSGFEGRDMTGNGTIENPSSTYPCELFTSTKEVDDPFSFSVSFDPYSSKLNVDKVESIDNLLVIRNIHGQLIRSINRVANNSQILLSNLPSGMYVATLYNADLSKKSSRKFVKY